MNEAICMMVWHLCTATNRDQKLELQSRSFCVTTPRIINRSGNIARIKRTGRYHEHSIDITWVVSYDYTSRLWITWAIRSMICSSVAMYLIWLDASNVIHRREYYVSNKRRCDYLKNILCKQHCYITLYISCVVIFRIYVKDVYLKL